MMAIKRLVRDVECNIREAREKICKAYEMMETDRPFADWQKDMALSHLTFNARGHELLKKQVEGMAGCADPLAAGMRAVYADRHAEMIRETAEIKAMIDNYGK